MLRFFLNLFGLTYYDICNLYKYIKIAQMQKHKDFCKSSGISQREIKNELQYINELLNKFENNILKKGEDFAWCRSWDEQTGFEQAEFLDGKTEDEILKQS